MAPPSPVAEMSAPASPAMRVILDALPVDASWPPLPGAVIQFTNKAFDRLFGYPRGSFGTADDFIDIAYIRARQRALARHRWKNFALKETTGIVEVSDMDLEIRGHVWGGLFVGIHAGMGLFWGRGALLGPSLAGAAMQASAHGLVFFVALACAAFALCAVLVGHRPTPSQEDVHPAS